jgi:hypothetical protein
MNLDASVLHRCSYLVCFPACVAWWGFERYLQRQIDDMPNSAALLLLQKRSGRANNWIDEVGIRLLCSMVLAPYVVVVVVKFSTTRGAPVSGR